MTKYDSISREALMYRIGDIIKIKDKISTYSNLTGKIHSYSPTGNYFLIDFGQDSYNFFKPDEIELIEPASKKTENSLETSLVAPSRNSEAVAKYESQAIPSVEKFLPLIFNDPTGEKRTKELYPNNIRGSFPITDGEIGDFRKQYEKEKSSEDEDAMRTQDSIFSKYLKKLPFSQKVCARYIPSTRRKLREEFDKENPIEINYSAKTRHLDDLVQVGAHILEMVSNLEKIPQSMDALFKQEERIAVQELEKRQTLIKYIKDSKEEEEELERLKQFGSLILRYNELPKDEKLALKNSLSDLKNIGNIEDAVCREEIIYQCIEPGADNLARLMQSRYFDIGVLKNEIKSLDKQKKIIKKSFAGFTRAYGPLSSSLSEIYSKYCELKTNLGAFAEHDMLKLVSESKKLLEKLMQKEAESDARAEVEKLDLVYEEGLSNYEFPSFENFMKKRKEQLENIETGLRGITFDNEKPVQQLISSEDVIDIPPEKIKTRG